MEMHSVISSNIKMVGWENKVLRIDFQSGGSYDYARVPEKIFTELMGAPMEGISAGKYFHANIKGKFKFKKRTIGELI